MNPAPTALLLALVYLSFVGQLSAEPPAFKTRLDGERAFVTKVGEANAHGMITTVQWTRGIRLDNLVLARFTATGPRQAAR